MRRFLIGIAVAAAVALPAGAQSGSGWVRHQGKGFSLELPASWADESKDRIRLIREVRRLAGDDPQIAALMDNLLAVRESNFAVKMIALDLAPSSLRTGFATNLNVVAERTALPLAAWRRESLKQLMNVDFVVQPIWWRMVRLPAGKAVRLTYRARYNIGGTRLVAALTQYALVKNGAALIITYTTLPKFAKRYLATFDRSARSLKF